MFAKSLFFFIALFSWKATADVECSFKNTIQCKDFDGMTAYCCEDPQSDNCCYTYEFWFTWYFWCSCLIVFIILLALMVTCCKAHYAKTRRITHNLDPPRYAFNVNSINRETSLPAFDLPPSYDQIRKDGIEKEYEEFAKASVFSQVPKEIREDERVPPYHL